MRHAQIPRSYVFNCEYLKSSLKMERCCGLVTDKKEKVPLKSVEVDVQVQGHVATVSSTLLYVNEEERPLEAVFVFPLPAECALCHFSAKLGDVEVVAKLQDKQKAREEYDDALSSGKQAFLLQESEQSPDIFQLNVGSLPPEQSAAITLVYISELAMQADDALRFCLPAVLNPRYTPRDVDQSQMATITSVPADAVPYTLAVRAHLSSPQPISKVESNCSLEPLEYINSDKTGAKVSLSSGHMFDRDVELLFYYQDAHKPTAIVEAGQESTEPGSLMKDPIVMLSCYPEFPASVTSSLASCGEFIFVVDRSGSMDCKMHSGKDAKMRIDSAKDTLLLLLKSLPMGCYFNIYGFGSRFEHFFPKSVEYSQMTMDEALAKVNGMRADMGGTEILQPLKHIYSQPCVPNHPRQIFMFTDGEVGNTKAVLDLVKLNVHSHRCFSFGIGEGASTALITGLAKEGSGHAQFITGTDRMQPKVMQSLRYALQPAVKDISVEWTLPDGVSVTTLSPPLKVLFHGQRALLYAQLKGESPGNPEGSVTIQYSLLDQTVKNQLNFSLKPAGGTGVTVHRLAARTLMRSMEMEERARGPEAKAAREKLLELSLQSGVSCAHTAFIATHKASGETVQGPLLHRPVPTPGMFFGGRGPVAMCYSAPMPGRMVRKKGQSAPLKMVANCAAPMARMFGGGGMGRRAASCAPPMAEMEYAMPDCVDDLDMGSWAPPPPAAGSWAPPPPPTGSWAPPPPAAGSWAPPPPPTGSWAPPPPPTGSWAPPPPAAGSWAPPPLPTGSWAPPPPPTGSWAPPPPPTGLWAPSLDQVMEQEKERERERESPQITDPLLQLISLQKATGSWHMDSSLAKVLGTAEDKLAKGEPKGVDKAVWATVLALIWLHGFQLKARDEWQFVAMKAASWIQAQKVGNISQCVEAGNALLGCTVDQKTLGL